MSWNCRRYFALTAVLCCTVWTPFTEVSAERLGRAKRLVPRCHGKKLAPCVCWQEVPKSIVYLPSDKRCGKSTYPGDTDNYNASIFLRGEYRNTFSVVVRNGHGEDRSPYEAALCTFEEFDSGLSECSRWKPWSVTFRKGGQLSCLGASGFSKVFKGIQRMTLKMTSGPMDVRAMCLKRANLPLNGPGATPTPTPTPDASPTPTETPAS